MSKLTPDIAEQAISRMRATDQEKAAIRERLKIGDPNARFAVFGAAKRMGLI